MSEHNNDFTQEENEEFEKKLTKEIQQAIEKEIILRTKSLDTLKKEIAESEKAIAAKLGLKPARFKKRLKMIMADTDAETTVKQIEEDSNFVSNYMSLKNNIAPIPAEEKNKDN